MAGFVYVMSNPAFPDLLKIGKSKKDPTEDRVSELNQTGVPQPFKVEYHAYVQDEDLIERLVHKNFKDQRPNKKREFFSVSCVVAINKVRDLAKDNSSIKYEEVFYVSPEELLAQRQAEEEKHQAEKEKLEVRRRVLQAEHEKKQTEIKKENERLRADKIKEAGRIKEENRQRTILEKKRAALNTKIAVITFFIAWLLVVLGFSIIDDVKETFWLMALLALAPSTCFVFPLIYVLTKSLMYDYYGLKDPKIEAGIQKDIEARVDKLQKHDAQKKRSTNR